MSISLSNLAPTADCATAGVTLSSITGSATWNYSNGTNNDGVGATYAQTSGTMASVTVDGVTLALGTVILVKDETTQKNNGLYVCTTAGSGSAYCVLTRHSNMDTSIQFNYSIVAVNQGTTNSNTLWMFQYYSGFVVDTNPVIFNSLGVAGMNKTVQTLVNTSGSIAVWNVNNGYNARVTLQAGANSFAGAIAGIPDGSIGVYGTLVVIQPSGGTGGTLTLPSGTNKVVGAGSGTVLLSVGNSYIDIITFYYDGSVSTFYWTYAPNFS
jgi:hypothetical protein